MDEEVFEKLEKEAVKEILQEFPEKLENVSIIVEDYPIAFQI